MHPFIPTRPSTHGSLARRRARAPHRFPLPLRCGRTSRDATCRGIRHACHPNRVPRIGTSYAFHEDAYGNNIGFNTEHALTNHLYSGEWTDATTGWQYNRARYFDPKTGRWDRMDDFAGNSKEPRSLHKYAYVHGDPVQGIDPTGNEFSLSGLGIAAGISGAISGLLGGAYGAAKGYSSAQIAKFAGASFLVGAGFGALGYLAFAGAGAAAGYGGQAGLGIVVSSINIPLALSNYEYARRHGDSVDKTFAAIDVGLAGVSFVAARFAAFSLVYQGGPISRLARTMQTGDYVPDTWHDGTAFRGSLLYGSIPEETGGRMPNFFTTAETLHGTDLNARAVWSRLQVRIPDGRTPRQNIGIYAVVDDIDVAFAVTRRNSSFGQGGYAQVFVPEPEKTLKLVGKLRLQ